MINDNKYPKQGHSLSILNQKLKKQNDGQNNPFQQIGKMTINDKSQQYNYSYDNQISKQIPVKATGKLGMKYYEDMQQQKQPEVLQLDQANQALLNLKKKIKHENLRDQGYTVNEKENKEVVVDIPVIDIYDKQNPHYRKLFDPDAFYGINKSFTEDDDLVLKEQEYDMLIKQKMEYENNLKKKKTLDSLNKRIEDKKRNDEIERKLQEEESLRQSNIKSIMKKNLTPVKERNQNLPKTILKTANASRTAADDNEPLFKHRKSRKRIKFEDEEKDKNYILEKQKQEALYSLENKESLPKWKLQSEVVRAAIRAARGQEIKPEENQLIVDNLNIKDLVLCEHCGRKFIEKAAEKHIPACYNRMLNEKIKTPRRKKINYK